MLGGRVPGGHRHPRLPKHGMRYLEPPHPRPRWRRCQSGRNYDNSQIPRFRTPKTEKRLIIRFLLFKMLSSAINMRSSFSAENILNHAFQRMLQLWRFWLSLMKSSVTRTILYMSVILWSNVPLFGCFSAHARLLFCTRVEGARPRAGLKELDYSTDLWNYADVVDLGICSPTRCNCCIRIWPLLSAEILLRTSRRTLVNSTKGLLKIINIVDLKRENWPHSTEEFINLNYLQNYLHTWTWR